MEELLGYAFEALVPGSIYAALALGIVLIYRGTGIVNFGHSESLVVGAFVSLIMVRDFGWHPAAALIPTVVLGAAFALVAERGLFRRLMGSSEMEIVLGTLAVAIILRGALRWMFGSEAYLVPNVASGSVEFWGVRASYQGLIVITYGLVLASVAAYVLMKTRAGLVMRATATDAEMAEAMGIDVRWVFRSVWAVGYAAGALAGALMAPIIYARVDMGFEPFLKGLAGAILGGFGSVPGAIVGSYLVSVIETVAWNLFSSSYRNTWAFLIIFAVLLIRPSGIFNVEVKKRV